MCEKKMGLQKCLAGDSHFNHLTVDVLEKKTLCHMFTVYDAA